MTHTKGQARPRDWQEAYTLIPDQEFVAAAMWRYYFRSADLLRERAERRAEEAERLLVEKNEQIEDFADSIDALTEEVFHLRRLLASEENTCEEAEAECRGLSFQHAQDVEVIRSLQEQLKEKDEEITALRQCVAERQEQRDEDTARQDKLAVLP